MALNKPSKFTTWMVVPLILKVNERLASWATTKHWEFGYFSTKIAQLSSFIDLTLHLHSMAMTGLDSPRCFIMKSISCPALSLQ